jgi:hypothetical protein
VQSFKIKNSQQVEAWCMKFVGPRMFYLHNSCGGEGWMIKRDKSGQTLFVEDEKKFLLALIKFSDS